MNGNLYCAALFSYSLYVLVGHTGLTQNIIPNPEHDTYTISRQLIFTVETKQWMPCINQYHKEEDPKSNLKKNGLVSKGMLLLVI